MRYLEDGNICQCVAQRRASLGCDGELSVSGRGCRTFTEEVVFMPCAFLQGQRTWGMGTTQQPFLTSRKLQTVATAKHSTTWACVMSMAEAPPGTSTRYCPFCPQAHPLCWAAQHDLQKWVIGRVGGKSSFFSWLGCSSAVKKKIKKKLLTSRHLDSKLWQGRDLAFLLCSYILKSLEQPLKNGVILKKISMQKYYIHECISFNCIWRQERGKQLKVPSIENW